MTPSFRHRSRTGQRRTSDDKKIQKIENRSFAKDKRLAGPPPKQNGRQPHAGHFQLPVKGDDRQR
jgi:hypothetical protein